MSPCQEKLHPLYYDTLGIVQVMQGIGLAGYQQWIPQVQMEAVQVGATIDP